MSRSLWKTLLAALVVSALPGLLGSAGCSGDAASKLVGTWETTLVGYNAVAQSVTEYNQTIAFAENGTLTLDTTLPGTTNHVTGAYTVSEDDSGTLLSITWNAPVDQPTRLYFAVENNQLITSPTASGLSKPPNLNVTDADPVVYKRIK